MRHTAPAQEWVPVCALEDLDRERGAAALVHGRAVAVFRTHDDQVFVLDNRCPYARASVLARGIVGTRKDTWFVASPMLKQPFDLRTGVCLDDPTVRVATYAVRVVEGRVEVGGRLP
ncbi:nitrite reductase small subunit NirD [Nocardioides massiliensis]|uniref:Nitrite reductase (NADH) small subunit n=1 Tax=Nocardioides massiliensis TaxID=1325935 RepID=A0ABT9NKL3_9ACTN|nr:nitrite reductase small subunit NirD [Nocardioides massiliensis]MDP9820957.1 nitrite reductase (NADH) small subunit [Nocardioides massiliensis]